VCADKDAIVRARLVWQVVKAEDAMHLSMEERPSSFVVGLSDHLIEPISISFLVREQAIALKANQTQILLCKNAGSKDLATSLYPLPRLGHYVILDRTEDRF